MVRSEVARRGDSSARYAQMSVADEGEGEAQATDLGRPRADRATYPVGDVLGDPSPRVPRLNAHRRNAMLTERTNPRQERPVRVELRRAPVDTTPLEAWQYAPARCRYPGGGAESPGT